MSLWNLERPVAPPNLKVREDGTTYPVADEGEPKEAKYTRTDLLLSRLDYLEKNHNALLLIVNELSMRLDYPDAAAVQARVQELLPKVADDAEAAHDLVAVMKYAKGRGILE